MAILESRNGDARQITLEGAIDIGAAAELQTALVEALRSGQDVSVSIAGVADLDVTAFQLLWAARRAAEGAGTRCTIAGPWPEAARRTLADLSLGELLAAETADTGSRA